MAFEIEFTPDAWEHLQDFSARDRTIILEGIETQLRHEPHVQTRNRKPLRENSLADWELRIGKFRVFYDIDDNNVRIVFIIAIGLKEGNRLFIGGKRFEL